MLRVNPREADAAGLQIACTIVTKISDHRKPSLPAFHSLQRSRPEAWGLGLAWAGLCSDSVTQPMHPGQILCCVSLMEARVPEPHVSRIQDILSII